MLDLFMGSPDLLGFVKRRLSRCGQTFPAEPIEGTSLDRE
jgi:hypothetical protein